MLWGETRKLAQLSKEAAVNWTEPLAEFDWSAAFLALPWLLLGVVAAWFLANVIPGDARAYYDARLSSPYTGVVNGSGAYLYSPAFLQVILPLQLLPFAVFRALMLVGSLLALAWMTGPVLAVLLLLPGPWSPAFTDLWFGNIHILTAAIVCVGFRWPVLWAALPFGKLTPGIALGWPMLHRQWRPLAVTVAVSLVSFGLAPTQWIAWFSLLAGSTGAHAPGVGMLLPRLLMAGLLVALGSWRGWRWTLPLAVILAQPVVWYASFSILVVWFWLLRGNHGWTPTDDGGR
jgi:hypothetical protein